MLQNLTFGAWTSQYPLQTSFESFKKLKKKSKNNAGKITNFQN